MVTNSRIWLKWEPTLLVHNFVNKTPLKTILVPIESCEEGLSNGTKFVTNRYVWTKLWANKADTNINQILDFVTRVTFWQVEKSPNVPSILDS